MRWRKNLVLMLIVALLFSMTMIGVGTSSPPPWSGGGTLIYIDHWLNSAEPGETFDVYVTAMNVEDLFITDVRIRYDCSVLEVVDDPSTPDIEGINLGDVWPYLGELWFEKVDIIIDPSGIWCEITIVSGQPLGVTEGLTGTVQLAKITFYVIAETDISLISIFASRMVDVGGGDIGHNVDDGVFKNVHPILKFKKVWREWVVAPWYNCLTNTLYAKVANIGAEPATFRVKFKVIDPLGGIDTVTSNEVTIDTGATATVSAPYHVPMPGFYTFTATIEYEWVLFRWISWEYVESEFGGEGTSKDVPGVSTAWFKAM